MMMMMTVQFVPRHVATGYLGVAAAPLPNLFLALSLIHI